MSNIFGSNQPTNTQNPAGGGLFGSAPNTNQPASGGLFGSSTNQNSGASLFGSTTNNNNNIAQPSGGGLFGSNPAQIGAGGGLFGGNNAQNKGTSGGIFGTSSNQPGGLFGASTNQVTTGSSLFGNQNNTNTAPSAGSLFGNAAANPPAQNTSLFGTAGNTNQNNTSSLFGTKPTPFGNNAPAMQSSLFGGASGMAQPQNQQQPQAASSLFGPMNVSVGQGGHQISQVQLQRLQSSGYTVTPNEKSVLDLIKTLYGKWNPDNENNILKTYFYNAVDKAYVPFFYPNPNTGEDEKTWEEALSRKPEVPKVAGADSAGMSYVPALCRGFKGLGERVETQARVVQEMRSRLHEMNNSLSAVMDAHQQRITVKIASAKKQHQVLAQRCLRLAVKAQVLRNRGYALDAAEENLRKSLISLEGQVLDAGFAGREDEIWARMVALRERARWLDEEGKKIAAQLDGSTETDGSVEGVSEDILLKTRRILKDYDDQLGHLHKELEDVKKEFGVWETTQRQ